MTNVSLRDATPTDAGRAGAILSEFIDETAWMPRLHTRAEEVAFVGDMIDWGWVTVAVCDAELAGFLARNASDIHALYVSGQCRHTGCGSALIDHAKREETELSLWTFQANAAAQAFYRAHGFVVAERTDGAGNDEKLPDIRLVWKKEDA
ncbi:MAG: GNAT family N-acetyltransferase [Pseudomonadota bacterium]